MRSCNSLFLFSWDEEKFIIAELLITNHGNVSLKRGKAYSFSKSEKSNASIYFPPWDEIFDFLQKTKITWKIKKASFCCIIPSFLILLQEKIIEILPEASDIIPNLIRLEASHVIPLPLDEVIWDYSLIPSSQKNIVKVIYGSVKKKFFEPLSQLTSKKGFYIHRIDATPLALYNACHFINKNQTVTLLLNIGISKITAFFIGPDTPFLSRIINMNAVDELHNLLQEAKEQGIKLEHLIVNGNDLQEKNIITFLQTFTSLPILSLHQLIQDHLSISPEAIDFSKKHQATLPILWGSALSEFSKTPFKKRLLPLFLSAQNRNQYKTRYLLAALLIFGLTITLWSSYFCFQTKRYQAANIEASKILEEETKRYQKYQKRAIELQELQQTEKHLLHLIEAHAAWPLLLKELHQCLPPRYVWITKLVPISEEESNQKNNDQIPSSIIGLTLDGLYLENERDAAVVDDFIDQLKKSKFFSLKEENGLTLRTIPDGTAYAYPFKLTLILKKPIQKLESF